ncbi:class I SAM-dependent methyltransferase [Nitrospinae bacterium AH_259_B05_G02_I21]|nr:class I SAM-dependent methyltransferase [Nitrospinae bacterium AH_259_B05_G02_I21]
MRGLTALEGIPRGFYQPRVRRRAAHALAGRTGRLLDVGCGRGFFLEEVAITAPQLDLAGIDYAVNQLTFTRAYVDQHAGSAPFLVGARAEALPFPAETFEAASCLNLFYNLPSMAVVRTLLLEMARILKPGGRCLVDVRNRWNLPTVLRYRLLHWHDPTCLHPLKTYTTSELEAALEGTGLRTVRRHRIGLLKSPFCPVIVFELEKNTGEPA